MDENIPEGTPRCDPVLDFACEVSLYRLLGQPSFHDLIRRARSVGELAAREGLPRCTHISDLFASQRAKYFASESLGWHYSRAYSCVDSRVDPLGLFSVSYSNGFVTIASRGVRGSSGEIRINEASVDKIFECVRDDSPGSYQAWGEDPYPTGGSARLLRMDTGSESQGQIRLEAGDLHPCRGALYFGEPGQECDQLGAFCRLGDVVRSLFSASRPSEDERMEVELIARAIVKEAAEFCFFPLSGYCFSCGADVTAGVVDFAAAAVATSCPVCDRTWCD